MRAATAYALAALLLSPALLRAGDAQQAFAEAQALFDDAKASLQQAGPDSLASRRMFREAATRFAEIMQDGIRSPNLCANAGNAFYFAGDDPRALLWYLRAERLANTRETRNGVASLRRACGATLWPPESGSIGRVLMFCHALAAGVRVHRSGAHVLAL
jgi:hypothetical protein